MSTSGTYNYRPKVDNPEGTYHQMISDGFLPSFHFGGSQVPINLGIVHGSGIKQPYKNSFDLKDVKSIVGRGIHTTREHTANIMFPKHYKRI